MDKSNSSSTYPHHCFNCKERESYFYFYEDYFTEQCFKCNKKKEFSYIEAKALRGMTQSEIDSLEDRKELFISKQIFEAMLENLNIENHSIDLKPFKLKDVVKEFLEGKVKSLRLEDPDIMDTVFTPTYAHLLSKVWVLGTVVKVTKSFMLLRHSTLQHIPISKNFAYSESQFSLDYTHIYVKLDKETSKVVTRNQVKIGELFFAKGEITRYKKEGELDFQYGIENLTEAKVFSRFVSLMFSFRPGEKYPTISFNKSLIDKENLNEIDFPYYSSNENEYYNPKGKYRYPVLDGYFVYELHYDQGWKLKKVPQRKFPTNIEKYTNHSDIWSEENIYKYEYFFPALFIEELHSIYYKDHLIEYGIEKSF